MRAMQIVKVRIRRGGPGEDMMVYPTRYNAQEVDRYGLGPLNVMGASAYSGHIGCGGDEEWCLIVLPPTLAAEYVKDPDMVIVPAHQADALMEAWRVFKDETEEIVRDPDRISAIQAKQSAGIALSSEDLKVLDPNDPTPGINKRLYPIGQLAARRGIALD